MRPPLHENKGAALLVVLVARVALADCIVNVSPTNILFQLAYVISRDTGSEETIEIKTLDHEGHLGMRGQNSAGGDKRKSNGNKSDVDLHGV